MVTLSTSRRDCNHDQRRSPVQTTFALCIVLLLSCGVITPVTGDYGYRLVGGNATYGRLEVRRFLSEGWLPVCNSGFDLNDAEVACRSLGFDIRGAAFTTTADDLAMSTNETAARSYIPRCSSGTPDALQFCSDYTTSTTTSCLQPGSHIILSCPKADSWEYRLTGPNATRGRGLLEARDSPDGNWTVVCKDSSFDSAAAEVACRSLGFTSVGAYAISVNATAVDPNVTISPALQHLDCSDGYLTRLDSCGVTSSTPSSSCSPASNAVHLICGTGSPWQFRLADRVTSSRGFLQARRGTGTWRFLCGPWLQTYQLDALRAAGCRSVGQGWFTSVRPAADSATSYDSHDGNDAGFAMSEVTCRGNERSLDECMFSEAAQCSANNVLLLTCSGSGFRLVGGSGAHEGRLETRPSTTTSWGTVCDDLFGAADAKVACSMFGFPSGYYTSRTVTAAENDVDASTLIAMDNVACTGSESRLSSCTYSATHNCGHSEDVYMQCTTFDVRLSPIAGVTASTLTLWGFTEAAAGRGVWGRVEVRARNASGTGAWGYWCGSTSYSSTSVCRTLGWDRGPQQMLATARRPGSSLPSDSGMPAMMNHPTCQSSSPSLDSCVVDSRSCLASDSIAVACAFTRWQFRVAGIGSYMPTGEIASLPAAPRYGRVEMLLPSTGTWGTVCARGIGMAEATVICRSLNFTDAATLRVGYRTAGSNHRASASTPTNIHRLRCNGDESSVEYCRDAGIAPGDVSIRTCGHEDDLFIECMRQEFATEPFTPPGTSWQYRLADGNASSGRVETRPNATARWGTVCRDTFAAEEVLVLCKSLRLSHFNASSEDATYFSTSSGTPFWLDNLGCRGDETSLDECNANAVGVHNCAHLVSGVRSDDINVTCGGPQLQWEYRLANPVNTSADASVVERISGRLEVRYHSQSSSATALSASSSWTSWGTVCNRGMTVATAIVACKSLGYLGAGAQVTTASSSQSGPSTQPIHAVGMRCTGGESEFGECPGDVGFQPPRNCPSGHSLDTMLECTVPPPTAAPTPLPAFRQGWEYRLVDVDGRLSMEQGRLQARPNNQAEWGSVCRDGFTSDAAVVACRSIGHERTLSESVAIVSAAFRGSASEPILVTRVSCLGTEGALNNCSFSDDTASCTRYNTVQLTCTAPAPPTPPPTDAPILVPYLYRLVGGDNATSGRLELRPHANSPWGTVCRLPASAALVACRSLGFVGPYRAYVSLAGGNSSLRGTTSQPIYFRESVCGGSEPRLDQCPNGTVTPCQHIDDTVLSCVRSPWEYRLRAGESASSGRLEWRPSETAAFGTVCNQNMNNAIARVACRSLGLTSSDIEFRTVEAPVEVGPASQPVYADQLDCTGDESQLDFCRVVANASDCTANDALHLQCGTPSIPWEYRLEGGTAVSGRLEVRPNATQEWGTVCADSFSVQDATVACRALGFDPATTSAVIERSQSTAYGVGTPLQPIWFFGGGCLGTELRPELCAETSRCSHTADVAVSCFPVLTSGWTYTKDPGSGPTGLLLARPNETAPYGTVCADGFDLSAAGIACRLLGYFSRSTVASFTTRPLLPTDGTTSNSSREIVLDDLRCTGVEPSLDACPRIRGRGRSVGCRAEAEVEISCRVPGLVENASDWQYDIIPDDSNRVGNGLLKVRPNSTAAWGTVCAAGFTQVDAAAACRGAGYSGRGARVIPTTVIATTAALTGTASSSTTNDATAEVPIWLQNPGCSETSGTLAECPMIFPATADCTRTNDVSLDCSSGEFEYRLRPWTTVVSTSSSDNATAPAPVGTDGEEDGAFNSFEGRLEVRPNSTAEWGTVCYDSFTQASADAVCRTMFGADRSSAAFGLSLHNGFPEASSDLPVNMARVTCSPSQFADMRNGQCDFTTVIPAACNSFTTAVHLKCLPTVNRRELVSATLEFRLVDLTDPGRGRLQTRPGSEDSEGAWGDVCVGGFSTKTAGLICQRLGYPNAPEARFFALGAGRSTANSGPIHLDSTTCPSTATSFSECDTGYGTGQCVPSRSVGIDCRAGLFQYRIRGINSTNSGRVEIRPNASAPWGTICTRGMNIAVPGAACRSLGFRSDAVASLLPASAVTAVDNSLPVAYWNVTCTGTELSLGLCDLTPVTGIVAATCTHQNDLLVTCGASDSESGCSGPQGCADWVLVAQDRRPDCAVVQTVQRLTAGFAVSKADCQYAAVQQAANVTGATPAYVLAPDYSRCDIYACAIKAATLVPLTFVNGTSDYELRAASSTPFRLFAPIRTETSLRGFCTRAVSCSNRGAASTVTYTRVESCAVGTIGCIDADIVIPTTREDDWSVRLAGIVAGQGRLEVRADGERSPWGTVCHDEHFDANEAALACQKLQYPTTPATVSFRKARIGERAGGQASLLRGLLCTDGDDNLFNCPHVAVSEQCNHTEDVYVVCTGTDVAANDVNMTTTTGAPSVNVSLTTTASVLGNSTFAPNSTVVATTTVAPTTTESATLGSRVVVESICQCKCDVGFFGVDCGSQAKMGTPGPALVVTYTLTSGTGLNFAERITIAEYATSITGVPGVRVSVDELSPLGTVQRVELLATSETSDSDAENAAALALLGSVNDIKAIFRASRDGLVVVDVAAPSYVLRETIEATTLVGLNSPTVMPGVENTTNVTAAAASGVLPPIVTSLEVVLNGAAVIGSSGLMQIELDGAIYNCIPNVATDADPCATQVSCSFALPAVSTASQPLLTVAGITSICAATAVNLSATAGGALPPASNASVDLAYAAETAPLVETSSRRQLGTAESNTTGLAVNATFEYTLQSRMQTAYLEDGDTWDRRQVYEGDNILFVVFFSLAILTMVIVTLVSVARCCYNMTRVDDAELSSYECRVEAFGSLLMFLCLLFYTTLAGIGMVSSFAFSSPGYVFIDEYRSSRCSASDTSFIPHRVSRLVADEECHPLYSYGTSEQSLWGRATCSPPNAVTVAFARTEQECEEGRDAGAGGFTANSQECYPEGNVQPQKSAAERQFVQLLCVFEHEGNARTNFIETVLDPVAQPIASTSTFNPATSNSMTQPAFASRLFFFVGAWRSFASRFAFDNAPEDVASSVALATFSESDVTTGHVGLPLDEVKYQEVHAPRQLRRTSLSGSGNVPQQATSDDLTSPMAQLAPLFNGYGSSKPVDASQYGAGAMRFRNVRGSLFDLGGLDLARGFTVTFWLKASIAEASRGFVFLVTDGWVAEDGGTPIAQRLQTVIENPSRSFFDNTWSAYSAVYVDAPAQTLRFMYRNPRDVNGGAAETMTWESTVLAGVFDGGWHLIGLGLNNEYNQPFVQLFVDGVTQYRKNAFKQCMAEGASFPPVRTLPPTVQVTDPLTETVEHGGVAYVGHFNGGVFAFQVHDRLLEQPVIASLGAEPMVEAASVWTTESRLTGWGFVFIAFLTFIVMIVHVAKEKYEESEKARQAQEDPDGPIGTLLKKKGQATTAGGSAAEGGAAANNASSSVQSSSTSLVTILPIVMQVCQNMTLYFEGWDWPIEFEFTFSWIYLPFSLNFFNIPGVPVWATFIAQFGVALIAMLVVLWLSRGDSAQFTSQVLDDAERVGLWRSGQEDTMLPDPDIEENAVSVLDFKLGGDSVLGALSRAELQNRLASMLVLSKKNYDVFDGSFDIPAELSDPEVITVLVSTATKTESVPTVGGCLGFCGEPDPDFVPEYVRVLAKTNNDLSTMLQLTGFVDIGNCALLQVYRRIESVKPLLDSIHDPKSLNRLIRILAGHYVLALYLEDACDTVRTKMRGKLESEAKRQVQENLAQEKEKGLDQAALNYRRDQELKRWQNVWNTIDAFEFPSKEVLEFENSMARIEDGGDFEAVGRRTLLHAARKAGIDVMDAVTLSDRAKLARNSDDQADKMRHVEGMQRFTRDSNVLNYISDADNGADGAVRDFEIDGTVSGPIAVMYAFLSGDHTIIQKSATLGSTARNMCQSIADEAFGLLVADLSVRQKQVASMMEQSARATLLAGVVRLRREDKKPVFVHIAVPDPDRKAIEKEQKKLVDERKAEEKKRDDQRKQKEVDWKNAQDAKINEWQTKENERAKKEREDFEETKKAKEDAVRKAKDTVKSVEAEVDALAKKSKVDQAAVDKLKADKKDAEADALVAEAKKAMVDGMTKMEELDTHKTSVTSAENEVKALKFTPVDPSKPPEREPMPPPTPLPELPAIPSLQSMTDAARDKLQPVAVARLDVTPIKELHECPRHATRLFPALDDVHGAVRLSRPKAYQCMHRHNIVFNTLCKDANNPDENKGCNADEYFVCPVDECNFSVCKNCMRMGLVAKGRAQLEKQQYRMARDGATATLGLAVIFIAQGMYQPAMRSAITTVFCHSSLSCQYPTCYSPLKFDYFIMTFLSGVMLLCIGVGLFAFLTKIVFSRKRTVLESTALQGHLAKERVCGCGEPDDFIPGPAVDVNLGDVMYVACEEFPGYDPYQALLERDRTMFKGLYEQYEFRWMVFHPTTFVFKIMIILVVLYAGEPNSLSLIIAAGLVEILQLVFMMMTSPFTDVWLDCLAKIGSMHQVAQLGLMCFFRADIYENPKDRGVAFAMIGLASVYILIVVVAIVILVIIPVVQSHFAQKEREEKAKEAAKNQGSGIDVIGTSDANVTAGVTAADVNGDGDGAAAAPTSPGADEPKPPEGGRSPQQRSLAYSPTDTMDASVESSGVFNGSTRGGPDYRSGNSGGSGVGEVAGAVAKTAVDLVRNPLGLLKTGYASVTSSSQKKKNKR